MADPSLAEWGKLYQAALRFREVAPWTWMENEELFAVVDPQGGATGYCSVMGSSNEEFGLGIFIGELGYKRYLELVSGQSVPGNLDEEIMVPLLTLLFVNREELAKEDRAVIRSLGLQFRGRNAWPLFRSQRPGYVPWFLEKEEAFFLTSALEQALVVADGVHRGRLDLFDEVDEDKVLTRYPRCDAAGDVVDLGITGPEQDTGTEPSTVPRLAVHRHRLISGDFR